MRHEELIMPLKYNIGEFEFDRKMELRDQCLAALAVEGMTRVGEFGGLHFLGSDKVLVTTGAVATEPQSAFPVFWCRVYFYHEQERIVRIDWTPVGAAGVATVPKPSSSINELTCTEEELTQCLMHLLLECVRRKLNSTISENIAVWYSECQLSHAPQLGGPVFSEDGRIDNYVWTTKAQSRWDGRQRDDA